VTGGLDIILLVCQGPGRQIQAAWVIRSMPLYFFNFSRASKSGTSPFKNDGLELAENDAAWEEATTACGEKLPEMDGALRPGDGWQMEVTDGRGETVYILTFTSEASDRGKR